MSISATAVVREQTPTPIQPPVGGWSPDYSGVLRPWLSQGVANGDASGGAVSITLKFRPSAGSNRLFVAITELTMSSSVTVGGSLQAYVAASQWNSMDQLAAGYIGPGVEADSTTAYAIQRLITSEIPVLLGELKTKEQGDVVIAWGTNTNTGVYQTQLRGWQSDRPFTIPKERAP